MSTDTTFHQVFASDNCAGICPEAWQAIEEANADFHPAYGADRWTTQASDRLRDLFEYPCEVFFTFNGTAANSLALASLCQSYHSVVAHEAAHIETDECGGPEFFTHGTKLLLGRGEHGRLDPREIDAMVRKRTDIHYPKPRAVSITQSTELGTLYRADHLDAVHEVCQRHKLGLHMDGARFANAIAALGCSPKSITWKAGVDVLCFGGTKNGMAVGDCVVFFNHDLAQEFAYRCKQAGQLASKMRYLSAPWVRMLQDDVWLKHAAHANAMARRLSGGLARSPAVTLAQPTEANGVFVHMDEALARELHNIGWQFYTFIGGATRFMCSWKTDPKHVDALLEDVQRVEATL